VVLAVIALVILPFQAIAVPPFYMLHGARDTGYVQFLQFIVSVISAINGAGP
jgi:multiple sugar transport system permease protein